MKKIIIITIIIIFTGYYIISKPVPKEFNRLDEINYSIAEKISLVEFKKSLSEKDWENIKSGKRVVTLKEVIDFNK